ncbi:zinc finger BED domain-containing 1-like protein [Labeo rohita]|uniref:Zinc finger BED domain-containing 1-like protein n=1 Tax=Labeo rohita TaxID=84645 RepID=A0A498MWI5_LABRO|nr:zinc finger BED domain-containing 1-like protein [Labeo rohita]
MVKTLDKKYVIPSRNYFSKVALPALYEKCQGGIEREITAVEYFATTTDLWSSRTMEPYMSLTIHYIDGDFTIKSRWLQTSFFPQDHTGDAIALGLREALASWRLVSISTDSGSNVIKAASLNKWVRLQCFGHRLHLAIENAMRDPQIDRAVGICKKLPVLHLFSSSILKVNDDGPELTNNIRTKILSYLEEKYKDPETQELLDMASALDPRFKLQFVSEDRVTPIQARLLSEMAASVSMGLSQMTLRILFLIPKRCPQAYL